MLPGRGTCPYLGRPDKGGLSVFPFCSHHSHMYMQCWYHRVCPLVYRHLQAVKRELDEVTIEVKASRTKLSQVSVSMDNHIHSLLDIYFL